MKKIVTIQDISSVGKCSLAVATPILTCMGLETIQLPTAVLSTHTAFEGFVIRDLTDMIPETLDQWQKLSFTFDAVYSGYLGSAKQISYVERLYRDFTAEGALRFVDPVMGDFGKLYAGFDMDFVKEMRALVAMADVCVPNLTEACLLADVPYQEDADPAFVKDLLKRLSVLGAKKVILTGAEGPDYTLGALGYDAEADAFFEYYNEHIPVRFHGTGDIFASVLAGSLTRGLSLEQGLRLAVDFVLASIKKTLADEGHNWYGVNFEEALPWLIEQL
ncbi:MAG: pyridoxamine kinase [Lachnospiraceae bacterium]|nr:pyridoxamine kinase [Lachnospiraceae bacterium]